MRFIGDVHAKDKHYKKIVKQCDRSIQVGDFGMGGGAGWFKRHPFARSTNQEKYREHRFIRGNHDDPERCAEADRWWIPDGRVVQDRMMLIGGAFSIDSPGRIEGVSWWRNEELSIGRLNDIIDLYEKVKPRVMITHDAPKLVTNRLMDWAEKKHHSSRTQQAFDAMLQIHSPDLWIFGHWHASRDVIMHGTRFICLNELEHIDIDLSLYGIDETKLWS